MCPLCKNTNAPRTIYEDVISFYGPDELKQARFLIVRCRVCGVYYTEPQLSLEALQPYYSEDYGPFCVAKIRQKRFGGISLWLKTKTLQQFLNYGKKSWWGFIFAPFLLSLSHYPRWVKGGRVLDLGCGSGTFLRELKMLDWEEYGIDPSSIAIRAAKSQEFERVAQASLEDAEFDGNFFDAVRLFHVFEHILTPHQTLEEIWRVSKYGGQLIISVPNFNSLGRRFFGKWWGGLGVPVHYFHYNEKTLTSLLEGAGFSVVAVYYSGFFADLFSSVEVWAAETHPAFKRRVLDTKPFRFARSLLVRIDDMFGNSISQLFGAGAQLTILSKKQ